MIRLQRITGWEQSLFAFTKDRLRTPYAWGENDCILFAADAVEAMTGEDLAADHRGTYNGPESAARIIGRAGASDLASFVGLYLPEIPVALAGRGDIGIAEGPHGDFAAVCQGRTYIGPSANGIIHVKRAQIFRAFKVGE